MPSFDTYRPVCCSEGWSPRLLDIWDIFIDLWHGKHADLPSLTTFSSCFCNWAFRSFTFFMTACWKELRKKMKRNTPWLVWQVLFLVYLILPKWYRSVYGWALVFHKGKRTSTFHKSPEYQTDSNPTGPTISMYHAEGYEYVTICSQFCSH